MSFLGKPSGYIFLETINVNCFSIPPYFSVLLFENSLLLLAFNFFGFFFSHFVHWVLFRDAVFFIHTNSLQIKQIGFPFCSKTNKQTKTVQISLKIRFSSSDFLSLAILIEKI